MGGRHQHFEDPITKTRDIRKTKFLLVRVFLTHPLMLRKSWVLRPGMMCRDSSTGLGEHPFPLVEGGGSGVDDPHVVLGPVFKILPR
jgi:hypothetical protein